MSPPPLVPPGVRTVLIQLANAALYRDIPHSLAEKATLLSFFFCGMLLGPGGMSRAE